MTCMGVGKRKQGGERTLFRNMPGNGGRSILHPILSFNVQGLNAQKRQRLQNTLVQADVKVLSELPNIYDK